MPKSLKDISSSKILAIILSTSTEGSGHFENTMLVTARFLIEMQWKTANIWLIFEEDIEEAAQQNSMQKVRERMDQLFASHKILCKPSIQIWDRGNEISTEDLLVLTGGMDISTIQPMPFGGEGVKMWNTNLIPPNTRYLLQCQPLWWEGETEKWQGSDEHSGLEYENGAQSGLWRSFGDFEYEDGDLLALPVEQIPTPETLPTRVIRPLEYLSMVDQRLSRKQSNNMSVVMYGSFPAGNQNQAKQLAIYQKILASLNYITTLPQGFTITLTRIAPAATLAREANINQRYESVNFVINTTERLPKSVFQTRLSKADLILSEGQNIENEAVCIHAPVFQWRSPVWNNNDANFLPQTYQTLEINTRSYLNEHADTAIDQFDPSISGGNFLTMMQDGMGNYNPGVWKYDKLTILLDTLSTFIENQH